VENVNLAVLTMSELIALSYQGISRKFLGSFLSGVYNACAVVTDLYILKFPRSVLVVSCHPFVVLVLLLVICKY